MRIKEKNYAFRKKLLKVHNENVRDNSLNATSDEFEFKDGAVIYYKDNTDVIVTAVKDFADYLYTSMNVSVMISAKAEAERNAAVKIRIKNNDDELGDANAYMGSSISVSETGVEIVAFDERGAAQALYYLEDLMNIRRAPFVSFVNVKRKALFSPRMIHSGYGIDEFPDAHLAQIAHSGMDAILVFVKGVNKTTRGFLDFNELIWRAAKYGIDVYAYSYYKSEKHPEEPDAEEFYEGTYGNLFKNCPKLKGVILVGESVEFPSKDPHTTGKIGPAKSTEISDGRLRPGWYPCYDYPQWLNMVKGIIRKYSPDADIVLWSYNWARQEESARIALIDNLPTDISLLATFSRPDIVEFEGVKSLLADYTLSYEGPSEYFLSEAKAAKRRGIRLYAMANTGGLTWDFGVIPYEPFPYQWERRYKALLDCNEKYGLCGLMESHHFGFYPSFVSEFAKKYYFTHEENVSLLPILSKRYGSENAEKVDEALRYWSDAIREYQVEGMDQYGPFRIGPAYPICFMKKLTPPEADYAHFGTRILTTDYEQIFIDSWPSNISTPQMRLRSSIKQCEKIDKLMVAGLQILETIENPNDELQELIELGNFIKCNIRTAINVKSFNFTRAKMNLCTENKEIIACLDEMENICREEIKNAEEAISYVQMNSRLGWEPSMEYLGDEAHIRWKIKQVESVINVEIASFRHNTKFNPENFEV